MKDILDRLEKRREEARLGGGKARIEAQHKRGKLTARERIELLLDKGSFEEFDMFVEHRSNEFGMEKIEDPRRRRRHRLGYGQRPRRLSLLQGFHGVRRLAVGDPRAEDHQGAGHGDEGALPIIGLFDAGGARIQEGVAALGGYGEVFKRNVIASGVIPQISVIMGPCAGGDVYSPAMTDFIFMVTRHELHVRHWPRRREDGDQRSRHRRRARRRVRAHDQVRRRPTAPSRTTSSACCRCAG